MKGKGEGESPVSMNNKKNVKAAYKQKCRVAKTLTVLESVEDKFSRQFNIPLENLSHEFTTNIALTSKFNEDSGISCDNIGNWNGDSDINWNAIPECLVPSAGELDEDRSNRKQQQLTSLIFYVCQVINLLNNGALTLVDFGAGSGHSGLLIAHFFPTVRVILAERKAYSNQVALNRMEKCNLSNVLIYDGDINSILDAYSFDIGVSLHSCGQFTDIALQLCKKIGASFVLVPCCYGQIARPPPFYINGINISVPSVGLSCVDITPDDFKLIASGADYNVASNSDSVGTLDFQIAKRCMRLIDVDRLYQISQSSNVKYTTFALCSLFPLSCSPKNNVIVGITDKKMIDS